MAKRRINGMPQPKRRKIVIRSIAAALLGAGVLYLHQCTSEVLPGKITSGSEFGAIIDFPESIHRTSTDRVDYSENFYWGAKMECRVPKGSDGTLLMRVYDEHFSGDPNGPEMMKVYADRIFAMEGHVHLGRASEAEWSQAVLVEQRPMAVPEMSNGFPWMTELPYDNNKGAVVYEGHSYRYPGNGAARAAFSPSRRRIALFSGSFTGTQRFGFLSVAPFTYYVDIYDVQSARKLASAQGQASSHSISFYAAMDEIFWISDRYFYMTLSPEHDRMIMFDFGP